jgi:hypothetical protein
MTVAFTAKFYNDANKKKQWRHSAPETPYVRKTDLSGVIGSIKHFLAPAVATFLNFIHQAMGTGRTLAVRREPLEPNARARAAS